MAAAAERDTERVEQWFIWHFVSGFSLISVSFRITSIKTQSKLIAASQKHV